MTSSTYRNKKSSSVDTYCTYYTSPVLVYHCSTSSSDSMMMMIIMMVTKMRMMMVVMKMMVIVVMMIIRIDHRGHHALLEAVNALSSSLLLLFNSKLNLYLDYVYIAINT